jgi:hypothetical protein
MNCSRKQKKSCSPPPPLTVPNNRSMRWHHHLRAPHNWEGDAAAIGGREKEAQGSGARGGRAKGCFPRSPTSIAACARALYTIPWVGNDLPWAEAAAPLPSDGGRMRRDEKDLKIRTVRLPVAINIILNCHRLGSVSFVRQTQRAQ